jgi:hypothetical protein
MREVIIRGLTTNQSKTTGEDKNKIFRSNPKNGGLNEEIISY